jgi:prepilin-type N-terminal cleavage/methylation domain-containing protein
MKSPSPRQSCGFTLFEVMMAIAIFVILVGGIYMAVSSAISASVHLGSVQMEARQQTSFVRFLRDGFLNLPAGAKISLLTRDMGQRGRMVELVIERASGAFETGVLETQGSGVVLAVIPDGKGASTFSMQRFVSGLSEKERDQNLEAGSWLRVLEEVRTVRWRFWDKQEQKFIETWDRGDERPELVELTYSTSSEGEMTSVFRLPVIVKSSAGNQSSPPTKS